MQPNKEEINKHETTQFQDFLLLLFMLFTSTAVVVFFCIGCAFIVLFVILAILYQLIMKPVLNLIGSVINRFFF